MKINGIEVVITPSYASMSALAADIVAKQVADKNNCVLGLATGSTPYGMYRCLIEKYRNKLVDFSGVTTFNLDEYCIDDLSHAQSYRTYMHNNFFDHVNVAPESIHIPDGSSSDPVKTCRDYDEAIHHFGGIDLQVLGIGNNGHIGFNEPDAFMKAETHVVELDATTIEANARFFDAVSDVPQKAISMGVQNIMRARKILMLANGAAKAAVVCEMLYGDVSTTLPASILKLHPNTTVILDQEAAGRILEKRC